MTKLNKDQKSRIALMQFKATQPAERTQELTKSDLDKAFNALLPFKEWSRPSLVTRIENLQDYVANLEQQRDELLAACKVAVAKWEMRMDIFWRANNLPRPTEDKEPDWIRQANSAIAAAEGRAQFPVTGIAPKGGSQS